MAHNFDLLKKLEKDELAVLRDLSFDANSAHFFQLDKEQRMAWYAYLRTLLHETLVWGKKTWLNAIFAVVDDGETGVLFLVDTDLGLFRIPFTDVELRMYNDRDNRPPLEEKLRRFYKARTVFLSTL